MRSQSTVQARLSFFKPSLHQSQSIPCGKMRLVLRDRPLVMGVLNVTPDSFSDGGRFLNPEAALAHALTMQEEGADLIDLGGQSTRPGSKEVSVEEELRRVIPVLRLLVKKIRIPVSVDTSKAEVAHQAIKLGAGLINDVTALRSDPQMLSVVANSDAALILMHMQGKPQIMQRRPHYRDVVNDISHFLLRAAQKAQAAGISPRRILLDPGLGFGKTVNHNLRIMAHLERFVGLGCPVLIGPSRKSFIGKALDMHLKERLSGTLACVAQAFYAGVSVVRVHDVKPTVQLLKMLSVIRHSKR